MTSSYTNMMNKFAHEITTKLSEKYGFDLTEAVQQLGIQLVEKKTGGRKKKAEGDKAEKAPKKQNLKKKLGFPLPFMGVINHDKCQGVKLDSQLYTQCTNKKSGEFDYCEKCNKEAQKLASGKPKYGDIRDRAAADFLEYQPPTGKKEVPLANVLIKKQIDLDEACERLEAAGIVLDEAHFVPAEMKRGRPKSVASTEADDKETESVVDDDLLGAVKSAEKGAKVIKKEPKEPETVPVTESKDDDTVSVSSKSSKKSKKDKMFRKITLPDGTKGKMEKATNLIYVDDEVVGMFDDGDLVEGKMVDGKFEPIVKDEPADSDSDDE